MPSSSSSIPNVVPLELFGDGLLPADLDGKQKPTTELPIPIVGTQDDGAGYGATFDALNIWDLNVKWKATPSASLTLAAQLPTAAFDSVFPCAPTSRDCLPQPGIVNPAQYLDILSYRQRPTFRLAYRNFKNYESMVTNQSVEALPGVAGVRWYETPSKRQRYTASISREPTRRVMASIVGWARSPRIAWVTWPLATASSTASTSIQAFASLGDWQVTRSAA